MTAAAIAAIVLAVLRAIPAVTDALSSDEVTALAGQLADAVTRLAGGESAESVLEAPLRRADDAHLDDLRTRLVDALPSPVAENLPTDVHLV